MIIAGQVGSAIAVSTWQLNMIKERLESFQYNAMISTATIKRRVAEHKDELEKLHNCIEDDPNTVSRRAALEAEVAQTATFQKTVSEAISKVTAIAVGITSKLSRARDLDY